MMYVVYSELRKDGRWFYGMYDRHTANEIALELNDTTNIQYCVCSVDDMVKMKVNNIPQYAMDKMTPKKEYKKVMVSINGIDKEYNIFHLYNSIKKHTTDIYIIKGIKIDNVTITKKELFEIVK